MEKLGILKSKIVGLSKILNEIVLTPRLVSDPENTLSAIKVDDNTIRTFGRLADTTIQDTFHDLSAIIEFLSTYLPSKIGVPLSEILMPGLTSRLVSTWLAHAVPSTLDGMTEYQGVLGLVQDFAEKINSLGWTGGTQLREWVERAPQTWLTKRRETSLDKVRIVLSKGLGATKAVEREETQTVSQGDGVFAPNGGGDDWDAGWSDEEKETTDHETRGHNLGEEDVSAWGLDDETEDKTASSTPNEAATADDDDDVDQAWGWGDDDDVAPGAPSDTAVLQRSAPKSNGNNPISANKVRQITLKETYTITAVPEMILDIVTQIIFDAESLAHPRFVSRL